MCVCVCVCLCVLFNGMYIKVTFFFIYTDILRDYSFDECCRICLCGDGGRLSGFQVLSKGGWCRTAAFCCQIINYRQLLFYVAENTIS